MSVGSSEARLSGNFANMNRTQRLKLSGKKIYKMFVSLCFFTKLLLLPPFVLIVFSMTSITFSILYGWCCIYVHIK